MESGQGRTEAVNLGDSPRQVVGDLLRHHLEEVAAQEVNVQGGSEVFDQAGD